MIKDFLEFIKYSLDPEAPVPVDAVKRIDWEKLFDFAKQQAIVGICFEGIKRLGDGLEQAYANKQHEGVSDKSKENDGLDNPPLDKSMLPNRDLVMRWMSLSIQIEKRNKQLYERVVKVSCNFRKEGFASLVLKGQGNALMYPNAYARTSGDIDIWVVPQEELLHPEKYSVQRNRERVIKYIRQFSPDSYLCFHHIGLEVYKDCEIEVHFMPTIFNNRITNRRLLAWIRSEMKAQFEHFVVIPGTKETQDSGRDSQKTLDKSGLFPVPTDHFNRIYQLCHIQHHYFDEGIGLRQMMDYYYLLKRGFTEQERAREVKILKNFDMIGIAGAVMYVMKEMLGLPDQYLLLPPDEKRGKVLEREILNGGNFGKEYAFNDRNKASKYFAKTLRNLKVISLYPGETLWEPPFRLWHFCWRMKRRFIG